MRIDDKEWLFIGDGVVPVPRRNSNAPFLPVPEQKLPQKERLLMAMGALLPFVAFGVMLLIGWLSKG